MKVTLIIDGRTADLKEDGLILLTYQNTDAEHPAAVKNSYSQTVSLPSTPNNDAIFSHVLRSDFKTAGGFNPLARTPFEIRNGSQEILESGYLKLDSGEPGKGYEITLFGGLGGFFYSLKYRDDGTERTLADLAWKDGVYKPSSEMTINVTASAFAARYNGEFDADSPYAFAPFNEGLPDDFDANKAYYKKVGNEESFEELRMLVSDGGKDYSPKHSGGGVIVEFSNEHDSWAMQEFRNTLQRPMWSVRAFLDAVCQTANNGGYDVHIDSAFLSSNFVKKGYVTLKNDWGEKIEAGAVTFADLLEDTHSPADYLLSIAKLCGLMFTFYEAEKRVQILTRDSYYGRFQATRFSLHGLIAEDRGKTITPLLTSDKWQVLSAENAGGKATDFADRKGREYGSLWLNTGYEFGGNENEVLKDSVFKGAADTLASSIDYRVLTKNLDWLNGLYWLKFGVTDTVKYELYTEPDSTGAQENKSFEPFYYALGGPAVGQVFQYNGDYDLCNFTEMTELRDADGDTEDGNDIIVFFNGVQGFPSGETRYGEPWAVRFYATESNDEMLELNGDRPCWNLFHPSYLRVMQFPVFRRQYAGSGKWSALFARPGEFFTPNASYYDAVPAAKYLGERTWKRWLTERCGVDVRKMKCWVNLRSGVTPKVGPDLLSYFWHYEGAWWVLDKINSHSLTTDDLTECEFVKVVDMSAYLEGQDYG